MKRIDLPSPTLEVRDLRLLIALSQAGTTKAAGKILHLAQPSISRALLSLEDRVGVPLFFRTSKGLRPTPICHELTARGEKLLAEFCTLEQILQAEPQEKTCIRVVSECHTAYHWLPNTLQTLEHFMPEVSLSLQVEHTDDPVSALANHQVDAALLLSPIDACATVEVRPLFEDELIFVVATSHPLARQKYISIQDLRAHPIFCGRASLSEQRWFAAHLFGRASPQLSISWVPLTEAIVGLVKAGLGIGLLTEWVASPYLQSGHVVAKRIAQKTLNRPWYFAWQRSLGDAGPVLLQALQSCKTPVM